MQIQSSGLMFDIAFPHLKVEPHGIQKKTRTKSSAKSKMTHAHESNTDAMLG